MTDLLQKPVPGDAEERIGEQPDHAVPGSLQRDKPNSTRGGLFRKRIARLTTSALTTASVTVMVSFIVVVTLGYLLTAVWLDDSASSQVEWNAVDEPLTALDDVATHYLLFAITSEMGEGEAASALAPSPGLFEAALAELEVAMARLPDELQAEAGDSLEAAVNELQNHIDVVYAKSLEGSPISNAELASALSAFAGYHESQASFVAALHDSMSDVMATQAQRAQVALAAVSIMTAFAAITVFVIRRIAVQTTRRETALQDELRSEKELMHAIVDGLPDSIAWKDKESRLIGTNRAMRQRLLASDFHPRKGDRLSAWVREPVLARYVAEVEEIEAQVIESGTPVFGRALHRPAPAGGEQVILRSAVPMHLDGEVVGIVSTGRDVSEMVEMERSLAAATRLESIGQLSAGVAHEINTPVQFVSDNMSFIGQSYEGLLDSLTDIAELLSKYEPETVEAFATSDEMNFLLEEIPDAIEQSQEGLQQIVKIVRAMKDFAHPGAEFGAADINRLVTSTVDVSRNEWKYDADLDLDLAERLPYPECDEGQIKQVILNIVVNAAHAIADSDRDRGTIKVVTSSDEENVYVSISDNGTGISKEVRERMFDRFYTTKGVGRGSGQGLAIAHETIKSHGGSIEVDSTLGVGTTFRVTIPIQAKTED